MGAGDVKLMASVGTFLGASDAFVAGAVTLVVGAVFGCGVVVLKQFRTWGAANDVVEVQSAAPANVWELEFPYAAAVAIGTVAALIFESPLFPFNR
jgi:prepilin peptidase CpaA